LKPVSGKLCHFQLLLPPRCQTSAIRNLVTRHDPPPKQLHDTAFEKTQAALIKLKADTALKEVELRSKRIELATQREGREVAFRLQKEK